MKRSRKEAIDFWGSGLEFKSESADKYAHFTYLGTRLMQPIPDHASYDLKCNQISQYFSVDCVSFFKETRGDFVATSTTREHLLRSILKMDVEPNYKVLSHPSYGVAVDFVGSMFDFAFRQDLMSYDLILDEVVMDTSSGVIEALRGLPKKRDCVVAGLPYDEYENPDCDEIPIWKVSGKLEIKDFESYVTNKKQRTFIIEPFGHLWQTKKYYGMQNKALKMLGWSFYGFNPYSGGTHSLGLSLDRHPRKWMFDGKGWDRGLSIMETVYRLRRTYRDNSIVLDWVDKWLINSVLQLPDGDVIYKSWGNNSGSGNTTGDNIIAMDILISLVFLHLGATVDEIKRNVFVASFGDDVVGSDSFGYSDQSLENAFRHVFTDLSGIVLDPLVITNDTENLTFLGFGFGRCRDSYVPKYDLGRLSASVLGNIKSMEPPAELNKLVSLMLMSAGNGQDVYNFFRTAVVDVINSCDHPDVHKLASCNLDVIVPSYDAVIDWYLGYEGVDYTLFCLC